MGNTFTRRLSVAILALSLPAVAVADEPPGDNYPLPLPPTVISLLSSEGDDLLNECTVRDDFLPLSAYFTCQATLGYCGVATSTMVLNSVPVARPKSEAHPSFCLFTQDTFFKGTGAGRVVDPDRVRLSGMSLSTLAEALSGRVVSSDRVLRVQ